MSRTICRLLPFASMDGVRNMAADEALLESASTGLASLRFYGWSEPTLSLGYFQPSELRKQNPILERLPWVRRQTGGAALVHDLEVTYALALPPGAPWQTGSSWLCRMHTIISRGLLELGVSAQAYAPPSAREALFTGFLCFRHFTSGDLMIDGAKVVGSAQRRQRGALLQHGGILLAKSAFTPALPGIQELSGRAAAPAEICSIVKQAFADETGWQLSEVGWNDAELRRTQELATAKYGTDAWNGKR
jgi:lipoyl(octanoyl) transferase